MQHGPVTVCLPAVPRGSRERGEGMRDQYVDYSSTKIGDDGDDVPCEPYVTLDGDFTADELSQAIEVLVRLKASSEGQG